MYLAIASKNLPPTKLTHPDTGSLPPRQINTRPIPRGIQINVTGRNRTHPPGQMLVLYNCQDYECEPDLVQKLTDLVQGYPPSVYLAPYPGMDAKIALAAPGNLEILETFDGRGRNSEDGLDPFSCASRFNPNPPKDGV